jgi:hypothetical protein
MNDAGPFPNRTKRHGWMYRILASARCGANLPGAFPGVLTAGEPARKIE